MKRFTIAVALMGLLGTGLAVAQKDGAVAKVNDQPISTESFEKTLVDWFGREVLDEMIQSRVIEQAAERAKVTVTEEQVEQRLKDFQMGMDAQAQMGSGESFMVWLAQKRMTIPNLRSRLRTELLLEGLVTDEVKVSEQEISAYYERNRKMFQEPTQVKIALIKFKTKEQAQQVRGEIAKGEKSWAEASTEYNLDLRLMKSEGELGWVQHDGTPVMEAAFALEHDGDITPVVEYQQGFYVIKRLDRRNARTVPFEEASPHIEAALMEKRMLDAKTEHRAKLMNAAHIEKLMDFPERAVPADQPETP